MKIKIYRLVQIIISATILIILGVGFNAQSKEKILRILNNGEPSTLDPHLEYGDWETNITRNMFWGLYVNDGKGGFKPGLAESYTINKDGTKYTFKLRHLKWSDGTDITAQDVVFSIRRALSAKLASKYASMLYSIANAREYNKGETTANKLGVKAIDKYTVEFDLVGPVPYFVSLTTSFIAKTLPKHTIEKYGNKWNKPKNIVVSGPYILKSWVANDTIVLEKRKDFFKAKDVKIDKLIFYSGSDASTAVRQFTAGEFDWNLLVPKSQVPLLEKKLGTKLKSMPILVTYYYVANNLNPAMKDPKVREALALAINRTKIAKNVMGNTFFPANTWIVPGIQNYVSYEEQPKAIWTNMKWSDRIAKAKKLLVEAGYNKEHPLTITLSFNGDGDNKKIAIAVREYWKSIGVNTMLLGQETNTHYSNLASGGYQIGRGSWDASYNDPMAMLFIFQSESMKNYANYHNKKLDQLIKQSEGILDIKKRANILAKVEKIILDDLPYIPLFYHRTFEMLSPKVTGWYKNPLAIHPIWLMDIKK